MIPLIILLTIFNLWVLWLIIFWIIANRWLYKRNSEHILEQKELIDEQRKIQSERHNNIIKILGEILLSK